MRHVTHTSVKRSRVGSVKEVFEGFNPVDDAEGFVQRYNSLYIAIMNLKDDAERSRAMELLTSAEQLLLEFLEDQSSTCTLFGDIETTNLIQHGTPSSEMRISVATLLFEEENGSELMTLSFWGDETVGRGAPLRFFVFTARDGTHTKKLVFYNSKFDNSVIAAGDDALFRPLQAKTHDPCALLCEAFSSGVPLKLDNLLRRNGLEPKTSTGSDAVKMCDFRVDRRSF